MRLNHLNLAVSDLAAAQAFFEDLFDFQVFGKAGDLIVALDDGHGFMLVLANAARFDNAVPVYPEPFHVGFNLDGRVQVDAMYTRVLASGIAVEHAPRMKHGHYGFYFRALDGIRFEVATHRE